MKDVTVKFVMDCPGGKQSKQIGEAQLISVINSGSTAEAQVNWSVPAEPGEYSICVIIDPDNKIGLINKHVSGKNFHVTAI